ncbi:RING finger domain-containing protein [Candidatus Dependentiae bacterium]
MENKNLFSKLILAILSINLFASTPLMCMNNGSNNEEIKDECCICTDKFKDEDDIIDLECPGAKNSENRHIYHDACLKQWFRTGKHTCPLCNRNCQHEKHNTKKYKQAFALKSVVQDLKKLEKDILDARRTGKNGQTKKTLTSKIINLRNKIMQKAPTLGKKNVNKLVTDMLEKLDNLQKNVAKIKAKKPVSPQPKPKPNTLPQPSQPKPIEKCIICDNNIENVEGEETTIKPGFGKVHSACCKSHEKLEKQKRIMNCGVCKNPILDKNNTRQLSFCKCRHYHKNCIENKLKSTKKNECPFCKVQGLSKDEWDKLIKKNKKKPKNTFQPSNALRVPKKVVSKKPTKKELDKLDSFYKDKEPIVNNNNSVEGRFTDKEQVKLSKKERREQEEATRFFNESVKKEFKRKLEKKNKENNKWFNWGRMGSILKRYVLPVAIISGAAIASYFTVKIYFKKATRKIAKKIRRWWPPCRLLGLTKKKIKKKKKFFGWC